MGYDSHFSLTFKKKDKAYFSEKETDKIISDIEASCNETPDETTNGHTLGIPSLFLGFYDRHWYDWGKDLAKVMKQHPELSLHVTREGEDHDDTEKAYWKAGGKEFVDCSDIILERPDPEEDTVTAAVIDSKDNSLSLVAIPTGVDPDEWLYEHFEGWDSNCTWQIIDKFRFNGTEIIL